MRLINLLAEAFLARKKLEHGVSSVRKHMQGEGVNLKRILETDIQKSQRLKAD